MPLQLEMMAIITQPPRVCFPQRNMDMCQGPLSNECCCLSDKALTRQKWLFECDMTRRMTAMSNAIQRVVSLLFVT